MPPGKYVLLHVSAIQGQCTPCGRDRAVVADGDPALSDISHKHMVYHGRRSSTVAHGLLAERISHQKGRQTTFFSAAHPIQNVLKIVSELIEPQLVAHSFKKFRHDSAHLVGVPRSVWHFMRQPEAALHAYVDTDYAGCHVTRRSTSSGIYSGSHIIKHWAVTQKHVTLSSGEAELGGVVKGAAEGLGVQSLAWDMGLQ